MKKEKNLSDLFKDHNEMYAFCVETNLGMYAPQSKVEEVIKSKIEKLEGFLKKIKAGEVI